MAKWVYRFSEGNASMRPLLGGKGANLAEMTGLGMQFHKVSQLQQRPALNITDTESRLQMRYKLRYLKLLAGLRSITERSSGIHRILS